MANTQVTKLIKKGHPDLYKVSKEVVFPLEEKIHDAVSDCIDTLRNVEGFWNKKSISIAAPQISQHYRFFVVCDKRFWYHPTKMYRNFVTFFNPQILEFSKEKQQLWEACISNNDEIVLIERPKAVKMKYMNTKGIQNDILCDGLLARIIQHEIDHLNGVDIEKQAIESKPISEITDENDFENFFNQNREKIIVF